MDKILGRKFDKLSLKEKLFLMVAYLKVKQAAMKNGRDEQSNALNAGGRDLRLQFIENQIILKNPELIMEELEKKLKNDWGKHDRELLAKYDKDVKDAMRAIEENMMIRDTGVFVDDISFNFSQLQKFISELSKAEQEEILRDFKKFVEQEQLSNQNSQFGQ